MKNKSITLKEDNFIFYQKRKNIALKLFELSNKN